MKTTTRVALLSFAAFGLLAGGFVLGGVFAARRAAFTANVDSLIYLRAIHERLAAGNSDAAKEAAATAINNHVEALQNIRQWPSLCLTYSLPWDRIPDKNAKLTLSLTRDYFFKHKDEFRAETQTFFAKQ